jgi:hypothetical protein
MDVPDAPVFGDGGSDNDDDGDAHHVAAAGTACAKGSSARVHRACGAAFADQKYPMEAAGSMGAAEAQEGSRAIEITQSFSRVLTAPRSRGR